MGADAVDRLDPSHTPGWGNWEIRLLDHTAAVEAAALNSFGGDYIAGGTGSDTVLGPDGEQSWLITGVDSDLLVGTRQYITKTRLAELTSGIKILRRISSVDRIILVTAREAMQGFGHIGRFTANFHVRLAANQFAKTVTHDRVVIGNNDVDHEMTPF